MMRPEPKVYHAHDILVAPARSRPELWRLLVGLGIVTGVSVGLSALLYGAVRVLAPGVYWGELARAGKQGGSPAGMLILMGGFITLTLGVMVAARVMQHRSLPSIIGPLPKAVMQFWAVFRLLVVLGVLLAVLPPYDMGADLERNMPFGAWLMILPFSLLVILIQTSAEEILFRGYIQQALAARFSSPVIWMAVPAVIFALGHYLPAEAGENAGLIAVWAGVFGLMTADLTARSGTLGPAIAVHLFNNLTALLFVAMPDNLNGLALYTVPFSMQDTQQMRSWLAVDFAMMGVSWLAARLALRR